MKKLLILLIAVLGLFFLWGDTLYAQVECPGPDTLNCDTLWIEQENGRIPQGTAVVRHVWAYHDEGLAGWAIPLKYRNPQTDVFLDSAIMKDYAPLAEAVIVDTGAGTINFFAYSTAGGSIPAGTDTFLTLYFRTGTTSWDPSIPNPIDTFRLPPPSMQGLSFVDDAIPPREIIPVYDPPGNLDVKDDPSQGVAGIIPKTFSLSQNYPNPFNAVTVISFALPKTGHVKLEIYNILGQKVKDLVDEMVTAGYKRVVWDGKNNSGNDVSSGVYFYRIKTADFVEVMKMTLLK